MPDKLLTYDLNTVYCRERGLDRSRVYQYLGRRLRNSGWQRTQASVWKKENAHELTIFGEVQDIARAIEEIFFHGEPGISRRHQLYEYVQDHFVRGGDD